MSNKIRLFLLVIVISFFGLIFSSCDYGIYDLPESENYNPFEGMDIKQFLDAKVCYEQLLTDLKFMDSSCYFDEKLASAQAYTILMSYGLADMAKESASLTSTQLKTKADLFDAIKLINLYSNSYDMTAIQSNTSLAIVYCNKMLTYFKN